MCFAVPAEDYEVDPVLAKAMDKILIFMLTMNKMHQHQQYVLLAHLVQIHLLVSLLVSPLYGALPMAVLMKLC